MTESVYIPHDDADVSPDERTVLYAEWAKFRDWLAENDRVAYLDSYRAGFMAGFRSGVVDEAKSLMVAIQDLLTEVSDEETI